MSSIANGNTSTFAAISEAKKEKKNVRFKDMVMYEDDPRVKEDFLTEEENSIVEGKNTPTKLNLYEA